MIHTAAVPRPVRIGIAAAGIAGALALAGCTPSEAPAESETDTSTPETTPSSTSAPDASASAEASDDSTYADGSPLRWSVRPGAMYIDTASSSWRGPRYSDQHPVAFASSQMRVPGLHVDGRSSRTGNSSA